MSLQEQIDRAAKAKLLLDDPLIKGALADMEATITGAWADLSVENKAQAEELKRLLYATRQFRSIFEITISGGAVAKNELQNQTTLEIRADAAKRRING